MKYLSVCSGIEAATVAWEPLGWTPAAFAEIEPFPSALLAARYPSVPNLGDMTAIDGAAWRGRVDLLVGGTPCQAFSVAGLRRSLDDARGNLTLKFVELADEIAPDWIVWENVPGALSTKDNAFGCFLGGLAGEDGPLEPPGGRWTHVGYVLGPQRAIAWRVLDAQYFGLAQRRARVFVVACPRNRADPRKVLFECEGLRRNSPPRREAGKGTTHGVAPSIGASGRGFERPGETRGQEPVVAVAFGGNNTAGPIDVATAVNAHGGPCGRLDFESETFVAHSLRADGFDASEDGTGRGTPLVPVAFDCKAGGKTTFSVGDIPGSLRGEGHGGGHLAVAFQSATEFLPQSSRVYSEGEISPTLQAAGLRNGNRTPQIETSTAVRRLTPRECERLQGFPNDYTLIEYRGKPAADGPRYKALGNSMAVPVMRWIGGRIQAVEDGLL